MISISDDDDDDVGCRMYEYDVGHDRLKRLWQATAIPSSAITTQIIPQPYQEEYSTNFVFVFDICIMLNVEYLRHDFDRLGISAHKHYSLPQLQNIEG